MECRVLDYYDGPLLGDTIINNINYIVVAVEYQRFDCYLFEVDNQTHQDFLHRKITLTEAIDTTTKWALAQGFSEGLPLYDIVWMPKIPIFENLLPAPGYKLSESLKL